eukprot:CAMPEP_0182584000 /NCGR_PEP_ID=MMETSP1324-20130603/56699_1 /TAXON_ID=236786 /ORGANISM="Florenciella sp., Strain RCC1587" /LENGTH=84 /DNA_ID=CAMNT_0024800619 /DNA_START=64 /DNA_END=315 /DNA_ORIENTATION=+
MAYPEMVSPSSAVAMMQAPCSLTALTWGVMRRGALRYVVSHEFDEVLMHILFFLSTFVFWCNCYAVFRRRKVIYERGFQPDAVA